MSFIVLFLTNLHELILSLLKTFLIFFGFRTVSNIFTVLFCTYQTTSIWLLQLCFMTFNQILSVLILCIFFANKINFNISNFATSRSGFDFSLMSSFNSNNISWSHFFLLIFFLDCTSTSTAYLFGVAG